MRAEFELAPVFACDFEANEQAVLGQVPVHDVTPLDDGCNFGVRHIFG